MLKFLQRIYEIPNKGRRFKSMEGLRAYAALLIFFVHYFDAYIREIFKVDPNTLHLSKVADPALKACYYLFASHYGVDIFFFLSGFLICRILSKPEFNYGHFIVRRVTRIYPAAIIAISVWAYIRIIVQGWYGFELTQFVGNLFFLNAVPTLGIKPYATITWSLFYEMVFYLTFPAILLISAGKQQLKPLKIIFFGVIYMLLIYNIGGMFIRFLMFFGGCLMATLSTNQLKSMAKRFPDWLVIIVFFISTLIFSEFLRYDYFIPIFVATSFCLVLNVLYGKDLLNKFFSITPLRYLGNISFSFYLIHGFGIEIIMVHYKKSFEFMDGFLYLSITITLCLLISIFLSTLLYLVAERPYFQKKKELITVISATQKRTI